MVSENEVARQVNSANLRQFAAVLGADEWQRAWEALAEVEEPAGAFTAAMVAGDEYAAYCAMRAEEPKWVSCDRCGVEVLEEEAVGGDYCTLFCAACCDTEQGERWEPEEFFEAGGEL